MSGNDGNDGNYETQAEQRAVEAGYQRTAADLEALKSGLSLDQIDALMDGRGLIGDDAERCPHCGELTSPRMMISGLCHDCYDKADY